MHDSVAAIRAGRSRARFVLTQSRRRDRQPGLRPASRTTAAPRSDRDAIRRPLDAVRAAGRSLTVPSTEPTVSAYTALRGRSRIRWRPLRDVPRPRTAAPWRG